MSSLPIRPSSSGGGGGVFSPPFTFLQAFLVSMAEPGSKAANSAIVFMALKIFELENGGMPALGRAIPFSACVPLAISLAGEKAYPEISTELLHLLSDG